MLTASYTHQSKSSGIKKQIIGNSTVAVLSMLSLLTSSELAAFPSEKGGDGWTIELGVGGEWEPTFAGSEDRQFELDPYISVAYRDGETIWYTSIFDYGLYHSLNQRWLAGASIGLELGREEDDDEALIGLGNIDDTWELRFDLAYRVTEDLMLAGRAMTAGAEKDNVYFIAALYDVPLESDKFELSLRSDISWGSKKHLQTEFGVTPVQSANSGYSVYQPDAGLKSIGAAVAGKYLFNKHWFSYAELSYEKYGNSEKDSPYVENTYDVEAEFGLAYRF